MVKPSRETAAGEPARTVPANTSDDPKDTAPPTVPSSPSADTRGGASTSTAEGPSRARVDVPSKTGEDHVKTKAKGRPEVPPPGDRVDDAHKNRRDKRMDRQE